MDLSDLGAPRLDLHARLPDMFSERAAITALRVALERQLSAYPTTMELDEELLSDRDLAQPLRQCVVLRLGEKRLLERARGELRRMFVETHERMR